MVKWCVKEIASERQDLYRQERERNMRTNEKILRAVSKDGRDGWFYALYHKQTV